MGGIIYEINKKKTQLKILLLPLPSKWSFQFPFFPSPAHNTIRNSFFFVICLPVKQNSVFLLFIHLTNRIERNGRRETSCLCPSLWKVGGGGKKNNIDLKSMEINNNSSKLSHSYFISTKSFTGINVSDNSISYHGVSVWMAISKFFFFWFSHFIYALSAISPDTDIGLYELTTVTMGRLKRFRMWYPKEKDRQIIYYTNVSNMI